MHPHHVPKVQQQSQNECNKFGCHTVIFDLEGRNIDEPILTQHLQVVQDPVYGKCQFCQNVHHPTKLICRIFLQMESDFVQFVKEFPQPEQPSRMLKPISITIELLAIFSSAKVGILFRMLLMLSISFRQ